MWLLDVILGKKKSDYSAYKKLEKKPRIYDRLGGKPYKPDNHLDLFIKPVKNNSIMYELISQTHFGFKRVISESEYEALSYTDKQRYRRRNNSVGDSMYSHDTTDYSGPLDIVNSDNSYPESDNSPSFGGFGGGDSGGGGASGDWSSSSDSSSSSSDSGGSDSGGGSDGGGGGD